MSGKGVAYSGSNVSVARSQERIRQMFMRYEVDAFEFSEAPLQGTLQVSFYWRGLHIRVPFSVEALAGAMLADEPWSSRRRSSLQDYEAKMRHKASQTIWRHVEAWLKAQFDAIDTGIITFAEAFMGGVVDAQGQCLRDVIVPQLAELASGSAALPALVASGRKG
jgi:hypothetical protein